MKSKYELPPTLLAYAGQWGVPFRDGPGRVATYETTPPDESPYIFEDWESKPFITRFHMSPPQDWRYNWPFFLHELGHCVTGVESHVTNELRDISGFELLSIEYLGLPMRDWVQWQRSYFVTLTELQALGITSPRIRTDLTWGKLSAGVKKRILEQSREEARKADLFEGSTPTFKIKRFTKEA